MHFPNICNGRDAGEWRHIPRRVFFFLIFLPLFTYENITVIIRFYSSYLFTNIYFFLPFCFFPLLPFRGMAEGGKEQQQQPITFVLCYIWTKWLIATYFAVCLKYSYIILCAAAASVSTERISPWHEVFRIKAIPMGNIKTQPLGPWANDECHFP